jgi:hypothetical protein
MYYSSSVGRGDEERRFGGLFKATIMLGWIQEGFHLPQVW